MVRWLERNGYDVSYFTDVDWRPRRRARSSSTRCSCRRATTSTGRPASGPTSRPPATPASNLAFFSGNEIYWKTRWESSADGWRAPPYRTLVSYKEGDAQGSAEHWNCFGTSTATRTRPSGRASGARTRPATTAAGQRTRCPVRSAGATTRTAIQVPAADTGLRFWRNAGLTGATTLNADTLGYEFDWEQPAYASSYPAGRITVSDTTAGGKNHQMSLYRAPSGALVFGAGTVQWSWGLDGTHDRGGSTPDPRIQQATVNLLADMGAQPASLQAGLTAASASTDTTAPTSTITSPSDGDTASGTITVSGTASDSGGVVAGVEVSTDDGATWRPATGRASWTFSLTVPTSGSITIKSRAIDDSLNVETPSAGVTINGGQATCPCSLWNNTPAVGSEDSEVASLELGVKFRSDVSGSITGIRFYKYAENTGIHIGNLWSTDGTNLGSVTFSAEASHGVAGSHLPNADRDRREHDIRRVVPHQHRALRGVQRLLQRAL